MDPDAALLRFRRAYTEARKTSDENGTVHPQVLEELISTAEALDTWLSNGGFLPEDWRKERERRTPNG